MHRDRVRELRLRISLSLHRARLATHGAIQNTPSPAGHVWALHEADTAFSRVSSTVPVPLSCLSYNKAANFITTFHNMTMLWRFVFRGRLVVALPPPTAVSSQPREDGHNEHTSCLTFQNKTNYIIPRAPLIMHHASLVAILSHLQSSDSRQYLSITVM